MARRRDALQRDGASNGECRATVRVGSTDMVRNTSSGKSATPKAAAKKHTLPKPGTRSAPTPKANRSPEAAKSEAKRPPKLGKSETKLEARPESRPEARPETKSEKKAVAKNPAAPSGANKPAAKPAPGKGPLAATNGAAKLPAGKTGNPSSGRPSGAGTGAIAASHDRPPDGAISVAPKASADKSAGRPQQASGPRKPVHQRHGFKTNEWIVYPSHGVGRIVGIEEQEIAGMSLELFVITFEKDKMTLRVPTGKSSSVGMRKLAEEGIVKRAMETLKGRARIKRTMWSRRAQEYEAKINSGDLIAIAEVVRDLYRSESQPEQSYSERQLYEAALDRMAREIAAVEKLDERGATQRITEVLSKSAKGRRVAPVEAEIKAA
jgi:CarD family transcriptional regulator